MKTYFLALCFLTYLACHKASDRNVEEEKLHAQLASMEQQLTELEGRLKSEISDPGHMNQLQQEKELLKARAGRLKIKLGVKEEEKKSDGH